MSFSSEVRRELCASVNPARHCQLAEMSAFINTACMLTPERVTLQTENGLVAQRYLVLLKQLFGIEGEIINYKHTHTVTVEDKAQAARIIKATGCEIAAETVIKDVNPLVVMGQCCKRAYIRGSFITGGTLSDPLKTYHLEFTLPPPPIGTLLAKKLTALLRTFGLHPKITGRKAHTVVYVKESEDLVDLLNIMEAHKSLLQLENVRILKEMRNSVNRKVNFETANLSKTVNAAVNQVEDIQFIAEHVGLGYLSDPLEEVARLRLTYGAASLKEIGAMLKQPVGKSGVNHRLRKISEIAEALRREIRA